MKSAEESSAPEMVRTTTSDKQVRFEDSSTEPKGTEPLEENGKPLTVKQALILNQRLRRMKRRLFLDAVMADNNNDYAVSNRDKEENASVTVNKSQSQCKLLLKQVSLDSSMTSLEAGSESQEQVE